MLASRPRFISFGVSEQALFARRLALYLRAGIPITQALAFITADTKSTSVKYLFSSLEETVSAGLPLSRGLALFPRQFDSFSIGFVRAGEASGTLSETLERLAIALQKRAVLRKKILSALAYPALIFCGTIAIALFLTLFIFPKIVPILKGFHTTLPLTTRILIGLNLFFERNWVLQLAILASLAGVIALSLRFYAVRQTLERILIHTPIFSQLYRYYAIATFSRTLSLQLKGGVRILTSLALVRTALYGSLYPKAVQALEERVAQGQRFSLALRRHKSLFPAVLCQMVAAGEATGTLSANLESIAELYEENLDELAKNLAVLIEPVLMVCMGFVVGFIALAIITPIYAVTQNLNVH